jgi:hypothetical protein
MSSHFRIGIAVVLLAVAVSPAISADKSDKKEKKGSDTNAPAAGEYVSVGDVAGILGKADSDSVSLRVPQLGLQYGKGNNRRPSLKEKDKDVGFQLTADAKIRLMKLPPKKDEKGRKIPYTRDELIKLKGKGNLPGYEASIDDLKPGMVVKLHLVRLKHGDKEALAKRFVSRVYIEGEAQLPMGESGGKPQGGAIKN